MEKEFSIFVDKGEEGKYLKVPFEVPEGIEKLIVSYDYARTEETHKHTIVEKNIIDFGLYSTEGFLGASGSNRNQIQISSKSDEGFDNTVIHPGTWEILLGAYKIQNEGVEVTYTIQFIEEELMLLNGDTHVHTLSSDGSYSYSDLVSKAEKEGLDYLILADHNNFAQNNQISGRENLIVIPGTEWTLYKGHANFIGAKEAIEDPFDVEDVDGVNKKLAEAKSNNALVSVNHPFCPFCPWEWGLLNIDFDLVEIWNGGLAQEANVKALEWWDEQLKSGMQIPIIAGSDFHKVEGFRNIGQPLTRVWTTSKAEKTILAAIAAGHTFVSYAVNAPTILIESDDGIQGDIVGNREIKLTLENVQANDEIHLISNADVEKVHVDGNYKRFVLERNYETETYLRVEIYRPVINETLKMPVSLSNPIYFKD